VARDRWQGVMRHHLPYHLKGAPARAVNRYGSLDCALEWAMRHADALNAPVEVGIEPGPRRHPGPRDRRRIVIYPREVRP